MTGVLEGQVAIVSGGGRGIGFAIAKTLAEAGAAVAVVARSEAEINAAASTMRRTGGRVLALAADVTDTAQVREVVDRAERGLGPVTLLVNNAGTPGPVGPDWEVDAEDWWRCVEVSVRGAFLCTQAALPLMLSRGRGRIINVASRTGVGPRPFLTGTSVAKTALIRFAEGLAAETQGRGVSVFAIHPGAVRTDMIAAYLQAPGSAQWVPALHQAPVDFWAPPEAAGALCVRLATGTYDRLSGRFLAITDNLDELVAHTEEIQQKELYVLRLQDREVEESGHRESPPDAEGGRITPRTQRGESPRQGEGRDGRTSPAQATSAGHGRTGGPAAHLPAGESQHSSVCACRLCFAPRKRGQPKNRRREHCTSGTVRGVPGNRHSSRRDASKSEDTVPAKR